APAGGRRAGRPVSPGRREGPASASHGHGRLRRPAHRRRRPAWAVNPLGPSGCSAHFASGEMPSGCDGPPAPTQRAPASGGTQPPHRTRRATMGTNSVTIVGRLAKDPALKGDEDNPRVHFTVAVDNGKDRNGNDRDPDWIPVVV